MIQEAKAKLAADERTYRKQTIQYASLFCMEENRTIAELSALIASVAETVLESVVLTDLTVTSAQAEALLRQTIPIVAADYKAAVSASIIATDARLQSAGITNADAKFAFWKDGAEAASALPAEFSLSENFPNPFNPSTTLRYTVPEASRVRIAVIDVLGRESALLVDEIKEPGAYTIHWNAGALSSGAYFCRMSAGIYVKTVRMMLQK